MHLWLRKHEVVLTKRLSVSLPLVVAFIVFSILNYLHVSMETMTSLESENVSLKFQHAEVLLSNMRRCTSSCCFYCFQYLYNLHVSMETMTVMDSENVSLKFQHSELLLSNRRRSSAVMSGLSCSMLYGRGVKKLDLEFSQLLSISQPFR